MKPRIRLDKKYRGHGEHIWCNKRGCTKTVTSGKTRCGLKDVLARNCPFAESHVYQSRIWNPITGKVDCIKSWPEIKEAKEFFAKNLEYRQELEENDYFVVKPEKEEIKPYLLHELINKYWDYLEDKNVLKQEQKHRSTNYIKDEKRYMKTFALAVSRKYTFSKIYISAVDKHMVELFYDYLNEEKEYSARTWNAHFNAMSKFFNWLIKVERYNLHNPFGTRMVRRRAEVRDPDMMVEGEFIQFLSVLTPENGIVELGKKKQFKKNFYRSWLAEFYLLMYLTGCRRQDAAFLKCGHAKPEYMEIENLKVNNLELTTTNWSYSPMTTDLRTFCERLGVFERDPDHFIIEPDQNNRKSIMGQATKSFTHYWKLVESDKRLTLTSLRKAYITLMILRKGIKGAATHHKNIETAFGHYFSKKNAHKDLVDVKMTGLDVNALIKHEPL